MALFATVVTKMRQFFNFTGLSRVSACNHGKQRADNSPLSEVSIALDYYNHTGRDICIVDVHNNVQVIPHTKYYRGDEYTGKFIITKSYSYTGKYLLETVRKKLSDMHHQLKQETPHYRGHVHGIEECIRAARSDVSMVHYTFHYEYTPEEIQRNGQIFDESLNLLIFCDNGYRMPIHPNSKAAKIIEQIPKAPASNRFSDGVFIEIIDNEGLINSRWVFMLGKTFRITPKVDKSKLSGVYVAMISREDELDDPPVMEYMTFEEAEKESLFFATEELARYNGNLSEVIKKERLEAEKKLAESQAKIDKVKEQGNVLSGVVKLIAQLLSVVTAIFTTVGGFRRLFGS